MNELNLNTTTKNGMSPLMESILNRYVLDANKTKRKYTKFGQKVDIPKGKAKTVAFDKLSPLPKATTPLTEGVTLDSKDVMVRATAPTGQVYEVTTFTHFSSIEGLAWEAY